MPTKRYWTSHEKLKILREIDARLAGISIREVCRKWDVQPGQVSRWRKNESKLKEVRPGAKTVNKGGASILEHYTEDILQYLFEKRECGLGNVLKIMYISMYI